MVFYYFRTAARCDVDDCVVVSRRLVERQPIVENSVRGNEAVAFTHAHRTKVKYRLRPAATAAAAVAAMKRISARFGCMLSAHNSRVDVDARIRLGTRVLNAYTIAVYHAVRAVPCADKAKALRASGAQ